MSVLTFNGYAHSENQVGIKIDSSNIEDQFRRTIGRVERWTVVGALKSDSGPSLQTQMANLEAAYKTGTGYGNAVFTAGANSHTLSNAQSFGGIRVTSFGYMTGPWKMRTELANRRSFYAVLQAEYRYSNDLYAYREELRILGNTGSKWIFMPSLTALPEFQVLNLSTPIKYIQRGVAVGRTSRPAAASPLFPSILHGDQQEISFSTPEIITTNGTSQQQELFGINWVYIGESSLVQSVPAFSVPAV